MFKINKLMAFFTFSVGVGLAAVSSGANSLTFEEQLDRSDSTGTPSRLEELYKLTDKTKWKKGKDDAGAGAIRQQAIKQAGFSWGVKEGLYWRYNQIQNNLEAMSVSLHAVFGFHKFLVDGKMLLPVVVKSERMYEQMNNSTSRTVNVSYTLDKPARLVPQPPTWRDYLIRNIEKPEKPHAVVFPRSKTERKVWKDALHAGWVEGVEQANDIFEIDLRRLNKELTGMYIFRELLTMNFVTMPRVNSSKYSVVRVDDGRTLQLNDVIYSITEQSEFTDSEHWQPYFRDPKFKGVRTEIEGNQQ